MDSRLVHNPVSPDLHLTNSPAHDAFQLFASRLLRPIWQRAIAAPPTKKVRNFWRKHFYIPIFNSAQNIIPKRRIKIESWLMFLLKNLLVIKIMGNCMWYARTWHDMTWILWIMCTYKIWYFHAIKRQTLALTLTALNHVSVFMSLFWFSIASLC